MHVHWTQEAITEEEIVTMLKGQCSPTLIVRLRARIARRHGRPRRRLPTNRLNPIENCQYVNEAA